MVKRVDLISTDRNFRYSDWYPGVHFMYSFCIFKCYWLLCCLYVIPVLML